MAEASDWCELTDLSKTCILHSLHVLPGQDETGLVTERLNLFCKELETAIEFNGECIGSADVIDTYLTEGAKSARDLIVGHTNESMSNDFDCDLLFRACWKAYRMEKRPDTTVTEFSKWHPVESDDCMYHLWLIFNAILSPNSDEMRIHVKCLNEIMKRLLDLCGHECSRQELVYSTTSEKVDYPEYLKAIANYSVKFGLRSALTCEVS